ncbi:hypothetical protein ACSZMQ_07675 [Aeromonas rivipollensis]
MMKPSTLIGLVGLCSLPLQGAEPVSAAAPTQSVAAASFPVPSAALPSSAPVPVASGPHRPPQLYRQPRCLLVIRPLCCRPLPHLPP